MTFFFIVCAALAIIFLLDEYYTSKGNKREMLRRQHLEDVAFWRGKYLDVDGQASIVEKSVAASLLEMWDPKYLEEIERTKRLYSGRPPSLRDLGKNDLRILEEIRQRECV